MVLLKVNWRNGSSFCFFFFWCIQRIVGKDTEVRRNLRTKRHHLFQFHSISFEFLLNVGCHRASHRVQPSSAPFKLLSVWNNRNDRRAHSCVNGCLKITKYIRWNLPISRRCHNTRIGEWIHRTDMMMKSIKR